MSAESVDPAWVGSTRRRLAAGDGIPAVVLGLLGDGGTPDEAAIAVCVAAGSTHEEAVERLRQFTGLWDDLEPGEEADGVDLLVEFGYFVPDAVLDEQQQEAVASMRAALATVPGWPSGSAFSLSTRLRTGHLAQAFAEMEHVGVRRWPDHTPFWDAMRRAGEILDIRPRARG
jgi:hypothetical protein